MVRIRPLKGEFLRSGLLTRVGVWFASFAALPYAMYGAMLVMTYLMVTALRQRGRQIWRSCGEAGFGWLTAGLLLSASFGIHRGDAFLQLSNFLPFFVLWGVWVTHPEMVTRPFAVLEKLARWLVLSAAPLCAIAFAEYALKFESLIPQMKASGLPAWFLGWIYEEPYFGHRARSLFDHPNGLAAYLVMVLGLGLGLVLRVLAQRTSTPLSHQENVGIGEIGIGEIGSEVRYRWALGLSVVLCFGAIFCTGSRNGVLIALVLVAIALYAARRYKWAWMSGLVGAGALAAAIGSFGIGGRSLSLSIFTNDPRLGVWRLATEMIYQRPWLGWGFSGLRRLYVPESIPGHESIYHAHNIWLFLASESGIPVMVGFCVVFGTIFYRAIRLFLMKDAGLSGGDRAILLSYLLAFSACLLFALFDVVLFDARLNIPAWGLLAALHAMSCQYEYRSDTQTDAENVTISA
ncbi:MAG: O-antigen ligase family protein [Cyanobacteria bacterium J06621_11]